MRENSQNKKISPFNDTAIAKSTTGKIRDSKVRELILRTSPRLKRTFFVDARINGKRTEVKIGGFPALKVAEARLEAVQILSKISQGEDPREKKQSKHLSVSDFLEKWLEIKGDKVKEKTKTLYQRHVNYVIGSIGRRDIKSVDAMTVQDLFNCYPSKVQSNRMIATLRGALNWGIAMGLCAGPNPCNSIELNPERPRGVKAELSDVRRIMEYIKEHESDIAYCFYLFLLRTGCRTGEAKLAMWADVRDGVWYKRNTKNRQDQRVYLGDDFVATLSSFREGPLLFGRFAHRKPWERAREACGFPELRMHDLRKIVATALLSGGAELKAVSSLLGHSGVRVTEERYAKFSSDSRKEVDAIRNLLQLSLPQITDI